MHPRIAMRRSNVGRNRAKVFEAKIHSALEQIKAAFESPALNSPQCKELNSAITIMQKYMVNSRYDDPSGRFVRQEITDFLTSQQVNLDILVANMVFLGEMNRIIIELVAKLLNNKYVSYEDAPDQ